MPNTPEEVATGAYMRHAWTAFAKDTTAGLLSYDGGWPTFDPQADTLARLAYANQTGLHLVKGNVYDGRCSTS